MNEEFNTENQKNRELKAFVGTGSTYYLQKWSKLKNDNLLSFNLFAFLFGICWALYRKMYLQAGILFLINIVVAEITFYYFGENNLVDVISGIIYSLLVGFLGNYFYLKHAEKAVKDAREVFLDNEDRKEYLAKKGGTSGAAIIIGIMIIVGISYLFYTLTDFLWYS